MSAALSAVEQPSVQQSDSPTFIGVDPDDTQEVLAGGARFTIGVVEQGVWLRLAHESTLAREKAQRRAIRRLNEEGIDPEEAVPGRTDGLRRVDLATFGDPEFQGRQHALNVEACKYAVRGHEGFGRRNGQPVPFHTTTAKHDGAALQVMADDSLRHYAANPPIVQAIWLAVMRMQVLGPEEKKG
jgi:hypothetical protein